VLRVQVEGKRRDFGLGSLADVSLAGAREKAGWRNPKHRAQWISSLQAYAFPAPGKISVNKIDGPMIRDMLLPIWLEKPETARRVRQRVAAVLDWSHARGLRDSEAPMRAIAKGLLRQRPI
jgi:hypothetical protein